MTCRLVLLIGCLLALAPGASVGVSHAQERTGRIEGRLLREDGTSVAGATVVLNGTAASEFTGVHGQFSFANVPPGTYSITLALRVDTVTISGVQVAAGVTTTLEETVRWGVGLTESLTVQGASRQLEPILEAAAAATLVTEADIERKASSGQLAKLLEFAPGAQVTQSGLWDFNMGTRGFNRSLSRRVAVLLDGRDLSLPFFGYQGWPAFSFPLDDLSSVELLRGPSGALYGPNASGGVISMTSKEPRFSPGGMVRVGLGQRDTLNLEGRWAGALGSAWYARVVGGFRGSDGFAVSRADGPEYSTPCPVGAFGDCLPQEIVPIDGEDTRIVFGAVRFDKYLADGLRLTMEGGHANGRFGVFQATGQRTQALAMDGRRPWARFSVNSDGFVVTASYDGYAEPSGYRGLTTGTIFNSESHRLQMEGHVNRSLDEGRVRIMGGAAASMEKMDSFNRDLGRQSFLYAPVSSDAQALFGLGTWDVTRSLRLLVAARGDWGSLHEFQLSPKASAIYTVAPYQHVRLTYNRSFQVSNSLEYFLDAPVAPPVDLSALNAFCTPFGVTCGFGQTPVLALGNEAMGVEHVRTWEVGYKAVLANRAFLTVEYYRSRSSNLATSLLPQVGTALGRLNPRFGPWQAPDGLPTAIADQIRALAPLLSNHLDGANIIAAASYTNFGTVTTDGVDVGVSFAPRPGWRSDVTYSWFDFNLLNAEAEDLLLANTPPHTLTFGLAYDRNGIGASIDFRWVDDFRWADGYFKGDVPSYTSVDLSATYPLSATVSLALNVSNLFDDQHWESFGGALLKRRALLSLMYHW
jgi:iron complex outermembrane receptor protein